MNEINYEEYSIQELKESLASVDKDKYPEEHKKIYAELNRKNKLAYSKIKAQKKIDSKEISTDKIYQYRYIAYILFLNSFLIIIQLLFLKQLEFKAYFSPMIVDIVFGILLLKYPSRLLANILAFRTIFGLFFHSFLLLQQGSHYHIFFQIYYCIVLLFLIYGLPKKGIRTSVVALTIAFQISFVALTFRTIIINQNLNSLYSLSDEPVNYLEGAFYNYELFLNNNKWFLRDRASALSDNPLADQWIVNPENDAHIMVIGEKLAPGSQFTINDLRDVVIENAKDATSNFKYIGEYATNNKNHSGLILHTKANVSLMDIEYLTGLYIVEDEVFQILTFCKINEFKNFEFEFETVINSFKHIGEIKKSENNYLMSDSDNGNRDAEI